MKAKFWSVVLLMCCTAGVVFAGSPDDRIRKQLNSLDLEYSITDDGDFRVIIEFDDGRSQLVIINSNTETLDNMEIREIWSFGYDGYFSEDVMKAMLVNSSTLKIGAWEMIDDPVIAYFDAKVPHNLSASELGRVILVVAETADEFEKEHLGTDDL